MNKRTVFLDMIRHICIESGLGFETFSDEWILQISSNHYKKYIFGYSFPLNPDTVSKICNDKSATAELLIKNDIPVIPHHLFHLYPEYLSEKGNWIRMLELFEKYGHKVVIKPNEGTGGTGVLSASSIPELEMHVHKTLKSRNTFCLCPYVEIQDEYRVIVLAGKTELIYKKTIPRITGNGKSTVLELLGELYQDIPARIFTYLEEQKISLHHIVSDQASLKLNWKHNLGLGAGVWLDIDPSLKRSIEILALEAAKEIGIQFASVDVICDIQGNLSIIEINSGVMLVNFSMHGNQEYQIAKGIYTKAIHLMMEE